MLTRILQVYRQVDINTATLHQDEVGATQRDGGAYQRQYSNMNVPTVSLAGQWIVPVVVALKE